MLWHVFFQWLASRLLTSGRVPQARVMTTSSTAILWIRRFRSQRDSRSGTRRCSTRLSLTASSPTTRSVIVITLTFRKALLFVIIRIKIIVLLPLLLHIIIAYDLTGFGSYNSTMLALVFCRNLTKFNQHRHFIFMDLF